MAADQDPIVSSSVLSLSSFQYLARIYKTVKKKPKTIISLNNSLFTSAAFSPQYVYTEDVGLVRRYKDVRSLEKINSKESAVHLMGLI